MAGLLSLGTLSAPAQLRSAAGGGGLCLKRKVVSETVPRCSWDPPRCAVFSAQLEVAWSWRYRGEFAQFESQLSVCRSKLAVGRDL